jgi:hypothetical protein
MTGMKKILTILRKGSAENISSSPDGGKVHLLRTGLKRQWRPPSKNMKGGKRLNPRNRKACHYSITRG